MHSQQIVGTVLTFQVASQGKLEITSQLQDKWDVQWTPEELVSLIEEQTVEALNIKLTNSANFAEDSRLFMEQNLPGASLEDGDTEQEDY